MLNNQIHFYQFRHLFKGDDYLGKYDGLTKIAHLAAEFEHLRQEVVSFFINSHGILAKVLVGSEELKAVAPLQEFPAEVRELMTPFLGDMTPEAVEWGRKNFTAGEFNRRYLGRLPELREADALPQPDAPPIKPQPPVPGTTTGTTETPKVNALGLPEGAPDDYNELIGFLKSKGVDVPRNTKKAVAIDLYREWAKKDAEAGDGEGAETASPDEAKTAGINGFAEKLYATYCEAVGGVAFNGDQLPTWEQFRSNPDAEKQSNAWLMTAEKMLTDRSVTTPDETAEKLYTTYCTAVGGVAFNGDPLPAWAEFRADPAKEKQSNAWVMTGELVVKLLS